MAGNKQFGTTSTRFSKVKLENKAKAASKKAAANPEKWERLREYAKTVQAAPKALDARLNWRKNNPVVDTNTDPRYKDPTDSYL